MTEKASLAQTLRNFIDDALVDVHTCIPGKVVRYDASKQQADVQPLLKRKYTDGTVVPLPQINNVPVRMPRAGSAIIHLPVGAGTLVDIHFSERSLDEWKQGTGELVLPIDPRKFDLSDCFAVPGSSPFGLAIAPADPAGICIQLGATQVLVHPNGSVSIIGTTVNLGADSLSEFAAIASRVESRLSAIENWLPTHEHTSAAPGQPTTAVVPPFVKDTSAVASSVVKVAI